MAESKLSGAAASTFHVVGIGASAGGLEALEAFLKNMPEQPGMAFVVVTHQARGRKSMLPELLARHTKMSVTEVAEATVMEPDRVYVAPPGRDVAVLDGALTVVERAPDQPRELPVDYFFRSLAHDRKDRAIGIILSGTGTDGTLGLKEIAGAGGMVMVQAEQSARYAGMPHSVLTSMRVDYELPVAELPDRLLAYVRKAERLPEPADGDDVEPQDDFQHIFSILRSKTGHNFSSYKSSTMRRRIQRRMNVHHIESHREYTDLLQADSQESARLFKELLIGVTSFFRDPESFEAIRNPLREHLSRQPGDHVARAWVTGCSTGEEAYSLAMLLCEIFDEFEEPLDAQVFATDLDSDSITAARAGAYPKSILADVGQERVERFFVQEDEIYRVRKELREMLVFAPQNMIEDPPFTRLDLIGCRNVLIYLKAELQRRLLTMFHYALRPGGLLMLGPSESISGLEHLFTPVDKQWKIFRRKEFADGYTPSLPSEGRGDVGSPAPAQGRQAAKRQEAGSSQSLDRLLLEELVPPSLVVQERGEIVYIHGRTGLFLEPAPGPQGQSNLFQMARQGLQLDLSSAIREAAGASGAVVERRAKVKSNGGSSAVTLRVKLLTGPEAFRGLYLVSFEQAAPVVEERRGREESYDSAAQERIAELERELQLAREVHQKTFEDLETSNEELKSTNEELQSTNEEFQSTNEELETSKEELQSLNEELHTVNAELQGKVDELSRANDDMKNLLNNTDIATIFLDGELRIKRYTEQAKRVIRLIPSDVGRPISDLDSKLESEQRLEEDAREVLKTLERKEAEVSSEDGTRYLMRILPYRTGDNVINGIVLTFVDITRVTKLMEEQARILAALERSPSSVFGQDRDLRYAWACGRLFRMLEKDVVGRSDEELLSPETASELTKLKRRALSSERSVRGQLRFPVAGTEKLFDVYVEPTRGEGGALTGLSGVLSEIETGD